MHLSDLIFRLTVVWHRDKVTYHHFVDVLPTVAVSVIHDELTQDSTKLTGTIFLSTQDTGVAKLGDKIFGGILAVGCETRIIGRITPSSWS